MGSAVLIFWASVVGVVYGWQPMPDGSQSYEYIVQLDPELVTNLATGRSIPVTADIPPELGPIGRIRIVVGREDLPRQRLTTQFKPWPKTPVRSEKLTRDSVVETQYTQTGNPLTDSGDRYGSVSNSQGAILPPAEEYVDRAEAFAESLQRDARQIQREAEQAIERGGQRLSAQARQILPPQGPATDLGRAVQAEARQLFRDQRSERTSGNFSQHPGGAAILPAGNAAASPPTPVASGANGQAATNQTILPPGSSASRDQRQPRLDRPLAPSQVGKWQGSAMTPQSRQAATSQAATSQAATSQAAGLSEKYSADWPASHENQERQTAPSQRSTPSPTNFNAPFPQPPADNQTATATPGRTPVGGPQPGGYDFSRSSGSAAERGAAAAWPADSSQTPTIRKEMFQHPAHAPVARVPGQSVSTGARGTPTSQQPPLADYRQQPVALQRPAGQPAGVGQNLGQQALANPSPRDNRQDNSSVFPLLLSWVLLSGSGAGNLYLFWSYFDVRCKYRELVHNVNRRQADRKPDDA